MQNLNLYDVLRNVTKQYPEDMVDQQVRDIPRISFNINIALHAIKDKPHTELEICDLGGGIGLFSIGCAAYGMKRTVLIDDFDDSVNHRVGASILDLHKGHGVEVISRDVVEEGIHDIAGNFDIITTFDSMEHWHHSPKNLFHEVIDKLKPGGVFVLGVPNCVNMRKRITVPLGIGKWSGMQEWYEVDKFRGHVREPDVNDLKYIARDMELVDVTIYGRNWLGYYSANQAIRFATKITDYPLRLKPSLCSDIYLVGKKA
ncbi:bifunctional 3-demethylubiquinone-9 3-methyltransferase/ 2-octaprenyl-6-hydroxy phenol methylase [bacterium BMS3Abin07]|nr:bifunctional 3-demethylubiquinone-9 3-methyltransferase/ 2-octaprenyl-6-hydroxy phenol methylase [bacterium BMS3Abin07]HDZ62398.1 class I SAM-dependent methyltransferase [Nitrospirota bacterium]